MIIVLISFWIIRKSANTVESTFEKLYQTKEKLYEENLLHFQEFQPFLDVRDEYEMRDF